MADRMTRQQRSECMSHIHSKGTKPEIIVCRELFKRGFRFRKNVRKLPGTPDIVLSRYRTAIFVNGCFWHGHKGCPNFTIPQTNAGFWNAKIENNRARDLYNIQMLEALEWSVITVWECEVKPVSIAETIKNVVRELEQNKTKWEAYKEKRKNDRIFAIKQAKKHREIAARLEAELDEQFHIPAKIRKESKEYDF